MILVTPTIVNRRLLESRVKLKEPVFYKNDFQTKMIYNYISVIFIIHLALTWFFV